jgi:hypothetical protein
MAGGTAVQSLPAIGGYFGLDLPDHGDPFPAAIKFQSGRAALRAVLESAGIGRVLLPAYVCDSVIRAVTDAGAVVETYRLDDSLYPKNLPHSSGEHSALLYVNYFGLCDANINRLLEAVRCNQLIVDNTQALFSLAIGGLATIYSPRKFVGVPDGGLLTTDGLHIRVPEREDTGSIDRMRHLFLRMAQTAQDGYSDYLESEESLSDTRPLGMSRITRRILAGIDMTAVKRQRRDNFMALAARLDEYNCRECELDAASVPLCYPLVVGRDVDRLKKALLGQGIYIPTYWPEVRARVRDGIEHQLTNCCLPVPCDQRYSPVQMSYLAEAIVTRLNGRVR